MLLSADSGVGRGTKIVLWVPWEWSLNWYLEKLRYWDGQKEKLGSDAVSTKTSAPGNSIATTV